MTKPRYVDRDDDIVYRPPYLQKDAFLSSFLIRASKDHQQKILDEQLNTISGGKPYRYRALLGHVALVLAKIGQVPRRKHCRSRCIPSRSSSRRG
jgi:hypothetical protein